jgi:phosphoribosyl-ATP pyrophosphohydrolase
MGTVDFICDFDPADSQGTRIGWGKQSAGIDMNALIPEIDSWLGRTFPDHTLPTIMKKLEEEYTELLDAVGRGDDLDVAEEAADLLIVLLILCKSKTINLPAALMCKHTQNTRRVWTNQESGIYKGSK